MDLEDSNSQLDSADFPDFFCNYFKEKHQGIDFSVETLMKAHKELLFRFFPVLLDKTFKHSEAVGKDDVVLGDIYSTLNSICENEATNKLDVFGDQVVESYHAEKLRKENEKSEKSEESEGAESQTSQTPSLIEDFRRAKSTQENFKMSQPEYMPEEIDLLDFDIDFDF